mmetsp:Transcript_16930/g.41347  ORF Transcript_16930/g.41347 Transcript_16930/m.41347 type:complete len:330 (-) Transcript_16930:1404-2393(-)
MHEEPQPDLLRGVLGPPHHAALRWPHLVPVPEPRDHRPVVLLSLAVLVEGAERVHNPHVEPHQERVTHELAPVCPLVEARDELPEVLPHRRDLPPRPDGACALFEVPLPRVEGVPVTPRSEEALVLPSPHRLHLLVRHVVPERKHEACEVACQPRYQVATLAVEQRLHLVVRLPPAALAHDVNPSVESDAEGAVLEASDEPLALHLHLPLLLPCIEAHLHVLPRDERDELAALVCHLLVELVHLDKHLVVPFVEGVCDAPVEPPLRCALLLLDQVVPLAEDGLHVVARHCGEEPSTLLVEDPLELPVRLPPRPLGVHVLGPALQAKEDG